MWLAALFLALAAGSVAAQPRAAGTDPVLEVFVQEGCPYCATAEAYLPALARRHPGLRIVVRHVDRDARALEDWLDHTRAAGMWPPGVPMFWIDGRMLFGFESPEKTGPQLDALVTGGGGGQGDVEAGVFGVLSVTQLGLPLFTLALGLLDGFNPCATWVLLFLLSLLVHLRDRRRMAWIAGTFVLVSGVVYYAFMAAWLNLFLLVGLSTPVRLALAAIALGIGAINVKDFVRPGQGFSLSIRPSAKPALYERMRAVLHSRSLAASLAGVAALAVLVNFVELLCTAGLPAVYTAVLTQQAVSPAAHYAYLGLYMVGYVADDALMVTVAVAALGSHKLSEQGGAWLKLVSGAVMLVLGSLLLLRPQWLF